MSREAPPEEVWARRSLNAGEGSDFGDSFLREVLQVEPSPRLPVPGERLGGPEGQRFEILRPMGQGGMGQVFRARDGTLQREVALKFLVPRPGFEALALAEARAVARLDHENIVRIFDVAEWSHTPGRARSPFLVMECLEGESLSALLKRKRLELRRALELLEAIAAGLAHAHARGIVHRDLKPGNVLLTRERTVKLLDFGLSHLTLEPAHSARPLAGGTPAYMAPEQWRGEAQDARTDIWAAGVVLYELLTGELPFQEATLAELRERITSSVPAPPARVRHPEVPRQLEALLATALAKEPAQRFSSALELREELRELRGRLFDTGHEVRGPAAELQRRQVTLVSCQLAGLAEEGAPLDAEDVGELELAFHEACVETFERHGGSVVLSLGGEVLACFGWAQGREDDSERAVRAGLQLTRELRDELQRRVPHLPLSGLSVRGGVHTELMAVGARLQGEAPRRAAWLARRAGPEEVLVSDRTWRLVRGAFLGESLGALAPEGLSGAERMEVHRVLDERREASRFERSRGAESLSPLVGRERELGQLLAHREQAERGAGAFVLVRGEAGLGKSRLIAALCERAAASVSVLRLQCWTRFSAQALHPVIELLRKLVDAPAEEPSPQRMRMREERLRSLGLSLEDTHLLRLLLSWPIPPDSPVLQLPAEWRKQRTFEALRRLFLECACESRTVLLVVEDLHWADSTLLEFLGLLLERAASARLLVVLSARPEFQPDWPARAWLHRMELERLPSGLAATLVREIAGDHVLPEETVQALVDGTDGIPLFIEEQTRMVLEGGAVASIPLTLHELLLARLDMLPSRQKSLAQLGAVVGREFSYALLAAVSEREEALLRRELSGLGEADLLREQEGVDGPVYQFRHALFQEAAYQSLSRSTRRRYHGRIARVLEARFPELVQARPEVLAYHLTESGEHARAISYWRWAGQLALQRMEGPESVVHLTRALELVERLPDTEQRLQEELRTRMALGASMLQVYGGDAPGVERMHVRLRELIEQMGEALPRLELFYWCFFSYYFERAEFRRLYELAEWLVELGHRHGRQELLVAGYQQLAYVFLPWGRLREALECLEQMRGWSGSTLEDHERLISQHGVAPGAAALAQGAILHSVLGQFEEARRWSEEALELSGRIGHDFTTGQVLTLVCVAFSIRREAREALRWADQALALSNARGYWYWSAWATLIRGQALSELGQPREGLALMQQALESLRKGGLRAATCSCLNLLTGVHLKLGEAQAALATSQEALLQSERAGNLYTQGWGYRQRGECLWRLGRWREAEEDLLRAIAMAREQGAGLFELRATVSLGGLLRDMGRTEAARRMLERACDRFAAGGDCVDLQEARALLKALSASGGQGREAAPLAGQRTA